jgi:hypothetical protein
LERGALLFRLAATYEPFGGCEHWHEADADQHHDNRDCLAGVRLRDVSP